MCRHSPTDRGKAVEDQPISAGSNPAADTTPNFWIVAIYLVDRKCGGPEEGGWWYDAGVRMNHAIEEARHYGIPQGFRSEEAADVYAEWAQKELDATINQGRREIGSVLSTGRYRAMVWEGFPPEYWPAETPHYE